jgi:hypothetical protein
MSALVALLLAQVSGEGWKTVSKDNGVTLEARAVTGSDFLEYRASAETQVSVDALCDKVFEWGSVSKDHENLLSRKLVEDKGETRVVYDQLDPPVVSRRDFAFTVRRTRVDDQRCGIDFTASNDRAPKAPDGFVRIEKLRGSWRFERAGEATKVTYTCFADPAGSIPAVFVHGSQRDAAVATLKKGIALSK